MYAVAGDRGSCASPVTLREGGPLTGDLSPVSATRNRHINSEDSSGQEYEPEPESLREQWHGGAGWGRHVRRCRCQAGCQLRHGRQILLQPGQTRFTSINVKLRIVLRIETHLTVTWASPDLDLYTTRPLPDLNEVILYLKVHLHLTTWPSPHGGSTHYYSCSFVNLSRSSPGRKLRLLLSLLCLGGQVWTDPEIQDNSGWEWKV